LVEANDLFNFSTETDLLIVGITSIGRFSFYDEEHNWLTKGECLLPSKHDPSEKIYKFSELMYNPFWAAYRSILAISTIIKLLNHLKIPYILYPAMDNINYLTGNIFKVDNQIKKEHANQVITKLNHLYTFFTIQESLDEIKGNSPNDIRIFNQPNYYDFHPSVKDAHKYLKKYVPEYDTEVCRQVLKTFDKVNFPTMNDYDNFYKKNFVLEYRQDYKVNKSLFLDFFQEGGVDDLTAWRRKNL
jgi:hypothetical protein